MCGQLAVKWHTSSITSTGEALVMNHSTHTSMSFLLVLI
jgi:hypothetical protein